MQDNTTLCSALRADILHASHGCCSAIDVVISPACMASSSLALEHLGRVCHMTEEGPLLRQGHVELSTSEHTAQVELFSHALHPRHPGNDFVVFVKQVPITEGAGISKYFKAASTPCPCYFVTRRTRTDLHREFADL